MMIPSATGIVLFFDLVIAEITIPLLAVMALKEVIECLADTNRQKFFMGALRIKGLALLFALAPSFFFPLYASSAELSGLQQATSADQLAPNSG